LEPFARRHRPRRAARGGTWGADIRFMRSGNRYFFARDFRNHDLGFRVVALD
jgi:formylglycine-generating enzyme required for sulfatase activity